MLKTWGRFSLTVLCLAALAVGISFAGVCACVPPRFWRRAAPFLMAITVALLAVPVRAIDVAA